MADVYVSSVIDAPADVVWARMRDFNALPSWHQAIAESRIESGLPAGQVGCVRAFRLHDGGRTREAAAAHRALEARETVGSTVLLPT